MHEVRQHANVAQYTDRQIVQIRVDVSLHFFAHIRYENSERNAR